MLAALFMFSAEPGPKVPAAPEIVDVRTAPDLNALFERKDGWTGGDGAVSVPLPHGRNLWLFSDTWVGKVKDGRRFDATIVNNTAAIQDGNDKNPEMRFYIRRAANE
jgi:hypothetical protein